MLDDEVREDTESFDLLLEPVPSHPSELELLNVGGADCQTGPCAHPVYITDEEDIPEFELSVSVDEIMEEGETSSTATLSITNGKTFVDDQVVTFEFGGDAIPGHDYTVTPADANGALADHQVTLPAGSASVEATFTAVDDEREEGDEKIRLSATHDGNAIGRGAIRIIDRFPGPRVEITFEGVQPPRDEYDDGIATGPFTTRITFSEQVEGFTQEDIDWQTHSLTDRGHHEYRRGPLGLHGGSRGSGIHGEDDAGPKRTLATSVSSRARRGPWPQATGTSWGTAACRSSCRRTG